MSAYRILTVKSNSPQVQRLIAHEWRPLGTRRPISPTMASSDTNLDWMLTSAGPMNCPYIIRTSTSCHVSAFQCSVAAASSSQSPSTWSNWPSTSTSGWPSWLQIATWGTTLSTTIVTCARPASIYSTSPGPLYYSNWMWMSASGACLDQSRVTRRTAPGAPTTSISPFGTRSHSTSRHLECCTRTPATRKSPSITLESWIETADKKQMTDFW